MARLFMDMIQTGMSCILIYMNCKPQANALYNPNSFKVVVLIPLGLSH
jgi:hypothetical protein